jgi:hypothetical protein
MSDTKQEIYRRCVAYLVNALQRNPLEESAEIIYRRNRLLGLQKAGRPQPAGDSAPDPRQRRQEIIQKLEELRSAFWVMPLATLRAELAKFDGVDFPDLRAAVDRLNVVAAHRADFPALVKHHHFDGSFFSVFKEVLVSSPKDVAVAKERLLTGFANRSSRRHGKKMIALVKKLLPEIYALEASWLVSLGKQRSRYKKVEYATTTSSSGESIFGSIPWWVFILAAMVIRAIFSASKH